MQFEITTSITDSDRENFFNGMMDDYKRHFINSENWRGVGFYSRNTSGKITGGLMASQKDLWLRIDYLWVQQRYRNAGLGSRLLAMAEFHGNKNGCRYILVETFSFQELLFYIKRGYIPQMSLPNYPDFGSQKHFLTKSDADIDIFIKETTKRQTKK